MEHTDARLEKNFALLSSLVIALSLATIFAHVIAAAALVRVWDDAYMTFRYAHNMLTYGAIAWNGSTPTFGTTSLLQIFVVAAVSIVSSNPAVVVTLASVLEMIAFLATIPFLVASIVLKSEALLRRLCLSASFAFIALGNPDFGLLTASGMDAMLALTYVSLYLIVMLRSYRSLDGISRGRLALIGILGGCAFLVRPDLMLFTALIPLCLALWSENKAERRGAWIIFFCTLATLGVILLLAWSYFGIPLPLSFFAKSGGHIYGPTTVMRMKLQPILELLAYLDSYKFLFAALLAAVVFLRRRIFRRGDHALIVGLVACSVLFILYYLFFVIQFMGYVGRFYYPTLPLMLVLACMAIVYGMGRSSGARWIFSFVICAVLLVALYTPFAWGMEQMGYAVQEHTLVSVAWKGTIGQLYASDSSLQSGWPCLDVWASLPPDASVATTEIGLPSVMSLDKSVIDLSGLQSNQIAFGEISRADAVIDNRVDLVYLPTEQYYPELRNQLLSSLEFQAQYEVFHRGNAELMDVAVRKASPYAAQLEACLTQKIPPGASINPPVIDKYYITLPYPLSTISQ